MNSALQNRSFRSFLLIGAVFFFTVLFLTACERKTQEHSVEKAEDPKTTFGQAVESAHELSDENDERNKKVEDQADSLFHGPQ